MKYWERCNEDFAEHIKKKYESPPTWIETETWSMGVIRDLLSSLDDKYKLKIVKKTNMKMDGVMNGWVKNLTKLRNICAHHGRLWNKPLNAIDVSNRQLGELNRISITTIREQKNDQYPYPNKRVYYYCMVIWYILKDIHPNSQWNKRLYDLLENEFPYHMPCVELLNMGFTKDWEKEEFWALRNKSKVVSFLKLLKKKKYNL